MSHFSFAEESCKHGNDAVGWGDGPGDDSCEWGGEGGGGVEYLKEGEGIGEWNGKEGEDATTLAEYVILAAADSRWHDTMDVPMTATDLSALLMMRASSSSLLPG